MTRTEVIMSFVKLSAEIAAKVLEKLLAGGDVVNMRVGDILGNDFRTKLKDAPKVNFEELDKEFDKRVPK